MTENEWQQANTLIDLNLWQTAKDQDRKWRLLAAACCQRAVDKVGENGLRPVVLVAEQYADGTATWEQVEQSHGVLAAICNGLPEPYGSLQQTVHALEGATSEEAVLFYTARHAEMAFGSGGPNVSEELVQVALARDIFGNPFRPVTFDPAWRTPESISIAGRMYDSRDFSAMPILADALEETGCTNSDVLLHCREPGIHVRGCWVVDLVLGKSRCPPANLIN